MSKFKVGDKVRIKEGADYYHGHKVGSIGEVTYIDFGEYRVLAESKNSGKKIYQDHEHYGLELVNPPLIDDEGEPIKDDLDTYMVRIGNGYLTESYEFILPGRAAVFEGGMNYGEAEDMANITGGEVVALTTVPVVEE